MKHWLSSAAVLVIASAFLILTVPIARAQFAGDLDPSFNPVVDATYVGSVLVQPDGKILLTGEFSGSGQAAHSTVVRLKEDGTVDASFNPAPEVKYGSVYGAAIQTDGKILLGGFFNKEPGIGNKFLIRLNADGSLDAAFDPRVNWTVNSVSLQQDGKILVGGSFTQVGGIKRNGIARINPDGTVDPGFDPSPNTGVGVIKPLPDGKILVGGRFTTIGGEERNYLARLNADGTVDAAFNPNIAGGSVAFVSALAVQPDGMIVLAGAFTHVGGVARNNVARVNGAGALDSSFDPNSAGSVFALAAQPDGRIVIGGDFIRMGRLPRSGLARLDSDGTLDEFFNPIASAVVPACLDCARVNSVALQPDGKILVGGGFDRIGGVARDSVARVLGGPPLAKPATGLLVSSVRKVVTRSSVFIESKVQAASDGDITQRATTGSRKLRTWCRSIATDVPPGSTRTLRCSLGRSGRRALTRGSLGVTLRTTYSYDVRHSLRSEIKLRFSRRR